MTPLDAKGKSPQDEVLVLAGQETLPPEKEQPSGEKPEPSTLPKTYTQEQLVELVRERHSELDKRIAELEKETAKSAKAVELATKRAADAETALTKIQKEKDEAELEGIKDNPDALSIYQAKQRIRAREVELADRTQEIEASKAEHAEALAELLTFKLTQVAETIAAKYEGVDAGLLIQLTDKTPEKMELLASKLGTVKAKQPITPRPDSGLSVGSAGKLTAEQIEKMSPEEYAQHPSVQARYK